MSGLVSYLAGQSAEDQVAAHYARQGHVILSRRWRGAAGEIDLGAQKAGQVVFVEVKKSGDHARAALHLSANQQKRILASAADFLGHMPGGQDTEARVDVALLDTAGRIEVIENALCA